MPDAQKKTRVLILGGGFGGLYAALRLDKTLAKDPDCEVSLVNDTNYTLFTPMLHEVAASDIDPTNIINPFRKMLKRVVCYEAGVRHIDLHGRKVTIDFGVRRTKELEYDQLLIALGSETKFFDEQTRVNAVQMKSLTDALLLRNQMIGLLEWASIEPDEDRRRRMLTFVVAGGGFAGVETIGAMNDFLREGLRYYPKIDPKMLRVVLVHPHGVLLPEFDEALGHYTTDRLREAGIEVRLNVKVDSFDGQVVKLADGTAIPAITLVWTAGVVPMPIVDTLPVKKQKKRIVANACMQVEEFPGVWAVGDVADIPDPTGKPYPATAQHAMREGKRVAKNIEATVRGRPERIKPFKYKMLGQLAAIGRRRGAAQVFGLRFSGFIAWWLWRTVYLMKLPRIEKKLRVAFDWTLDLFFSKDVVQIINIKEIQRFTEIGTRRFHLLDAAKNPGEVEHPAGDGRAAPEPATHGETVSTGSGSRVSGPG
jgi:NADH dehydrogenase